MPKDCLAKILRNCSKDANFATKETQRTFKMAKKYLQIY
jgi:hypothetical protein